MTDYAKEALEQNKIAVSKIRVSYKDNRTGAKEEVTFFKLGENFSKEKAILALGKLGYTFIDSEIINTEYGNFSPEGIYNAFYMARMEAQ